jgi:hypothetical protein
MNNNTTTHQRIQTLRANIESLLHEENNMLGRSNPELEALMSRLAKLEQLLSL